MIIKGCESCRRRHVKCTLGEDASVCDKCAELGQECKLAPSFRFCHVRYIYQKEDGNRSKYDFSWDADQPWVEITSPVNFVAEKLDDLPEWAASLPDGAGEFNVIWPENSHHVPTQERTPLNNARPTTPMSPVHHQHQDQVSCEGATPRDHSIPDLSSPPVSLSSTIIQNNPVSSDYQETSGSHQGRFRLNPNSPPQRRAAELTTREAFLIRSYTRKVAPWMDVCDPLCHFGNEVPRRALENPMVMYAILALASRHQAIMNGSTDEEFEDNKYHGRCLELLIPALSRPEETYDDNLLVTIVLLRQHEELENRKDTRYHFFGFMKMFNIISKFSSSGGLAEAASWLFIRQAIYVSLVQRESWQLRLENYERSQAFRCLDDSSFANVSVFLLARALRIVSRQSENDLPPERQEWEAVEEDAARWKNNIPSSFTPLKYRAADPENGRPFPELWMISGTTAVGLQYYYATLLVLNIHKPQPVGISAFESAKLRRAGEIAAVQYLLDIIGLAISNEGVDNANFTASHLICSYGYCISAASQRRGAISFLRHVEESMGWRICWVIEDLIRQWEEMDGLEHALRLE